MLWSYKNLSFWASLHLQTIFVFICINPPRIFSMEHHYISVNKRQVNEMRTIFQIKISLQLCVHFVHHYENWTFQIICNVSAVTICILSTFGPNNMLLTLIVVNLAKIFSKYFCVLPTAVCQLPKNSLWYLNPFTSDYFVFNYSFYACCNVMTF